ncbi:multidrug efflux SMR transporter [Planctomycetota bacterium]|nr:multidrug efflux SMR transporter [Planctomycetota bacterium]
MVYLYLAIAIVSEVIATSALKATDGFTKLWMSVLVVFGYSSAFYFLSLVLQKMKVGVAYAIWCAVGIALVSGVGVIIYKEKLGVVELAGMGLIVIGVALLLGVSKTA